MKKIPETGPPQQMDKQNLISENDVAQAMWVMLAQLGVIVDNIDDEGNIYYTVPRTSTMMISVRTVLPGMETHVGDSDEELAGELLIAFADGYFKDNGLIPHGGIREQSWSSALGELNAQQEQMNIAKEGPEILRI